MKNIEKKSYETIKLNYDCIGCGLANTGFIYTCENCTKRLPIDFYNDKIFRGIVPGHIPTEHKSQYIAKYIIKYFKGRENEISNNM